MALTGNSLCQFDLSYWTGGLRTLHELLRLSGDSELDEDTYKLLEVLAHVEGLDVEKNKRKDKVNMCKAIEEIKEKAREEGKEEERVRITCEYVREGLLKIADAAKKLNMPQEELELLLNNM